MSVKRKTKRATRAKRTKAQPDGMAKKLANINAANREFWKRETKVFDELVDKLHIPAHGVQGFQCIVNTNSSAT
jgi:hypothetical protein